jgi:hypothetical protein
MKPNPWPPGGEQSRGVRKRRVRGYEQGVRRASVVAWPPPAPWLLGTGCSTAVAGLVVTHHFAPETESGYDAHQQQGQQQQQRANAELKHLAGPGEVEYDGQVQHP